MATPSQLLTLQMVAIEQASIAKKCNIQFQGKPSGQQGAFWWPQWRQSACQAA
jgi:hypothetical protein